MKRTIFFLLGLAGVAIMTIPIVNSHPTGAPITAVTGAPGEQTCNQPGCHTGKSVITHSHVIQFIMADNNGDSVDSYIPGQTYNIIIQATDAAAKAFGFEATVKDIHNHFAGKLAVGMDNSVHLVGPNYITHSNPNPLKTGMDQWMFKWTAPAQNVGNIILYAAVNAANGNGLETGDQIYTNSMTFGEISTAVSPTENAFSSAISLYPNPVTDWLSIHFAGDKALLTIFTLSGRKVLEGTNIIPHVFNINTSGLPQGAYILRIAANGNIGIKKFIISH